LKNVRSSQVTVELSDGTQLLKEDEGWPDDQGTIKEKALNVVYEEKIEGPRTLDTLSHWAISPNIIVDYLISRLLRFASCSH
jgi:hypothetical protein